MREFHSHSSADRPRRSINEQRDKSAKWKAAIWEENGRGKCAKIVFSICSPSRQFLRIIREFLFLSVCKKETKAWGASTPTVWAQRNGKWSRNHSIFPPHYFLGLLKSIHIHPGFFVSLLWYIKTGGRSFVAPICSNEHACTKFSIQFIFLESEVCLAHPKLLASLQLTILPLQESFKNIEHKRFSFQISLFFSKNSPAFVSSPQNCSAGIFSHWKKSWWSHEDTSNIVWESLETKKGPPLSQMRSDYEDKKNSVWCHFSRDYCRL